MKSTILIALTAILASGMAQAIVAPEKGCPHGWLVNNSCALGPDIKKFKAAPFLGKKKVQGPKRKVFTSPNARAKRGVGMKGGFGRMKMKRWAHSHSLSK